MEYRQSIVFFIHSLSGGGAERICSLLANNFSERAYRVVVVTIKKPTSTDYFLAPGVNRISLAADKKSDNVISALKNNVVLVTKLRKVIIDKKADYVISLMTQGNIVCSLACINIKTFHIASERNYPPMQDIGSLWNLLRKYSYLLPEVIVSQTHKTSKWMEDNTKCTKTAVIPNPVVYPLQPVQFQSQSDKDTPVVRGYNIVLGVGRLVDQKQFDSLIEAFSVIANEYPKWKLIIVGEGPNRKNLQQQINSLSLQRRIQLVGKQANMEYWYRKAEIFVLTSKYEGYPNALLEAMCHGVPPISYRCDTGPETIIEHGHNGLLVPVDDKKQLAASIRRLIDEPELKGKLGNNAREVIDSHSIDYVMTQWESLFYMS